MLILTALEPTVVRVGHHDAPVHVLHGIKGVASGQGQKLCTRECLAVEDVRGRLTEEGAERHLCVIDADARTRRACPRFARLLAGRCKGGQDGAMRNLNNSG